MTHQLKAYRNRISSYAGSSIFLAVFLFAVLYFVIPALADPIPRLSDQYYRDELIEMTSEYDSAVTFQQAEKNPYINKRLIVKTYDGTLDPEKYGAVDAIRDRSGHYIIQFASSAAARRAQQKLQREVSVLYVEPDVPVFAQKETGSLQDTLYDWGTTYTKCDLYADSLKSRNLNRSVRIAVLDSGILYSHELFQNRIDTSSLQDPSKIVDYVNHDNDASDDYGHGTQVAGIIAKNTPGLNQIKILPIKVMDAEGTGSLSVTSSAIHALTEAKAADIMNMSFVVAGRVPLHSSLEDYGEDNPELLKEQIVRATKAGIVVVVSAGNQADDTAYHPPADIQDNKASGCIIVSSCDRKGKPADSSNYGESVDVCAPGQDVITASIADDHATETVGGTSFAAPCVAAAAAMLKLSMPDTDPEEMEDYIETFTNDIKDSSGRNYGSGILDFTDNVPGEYYKKIEAVDEEIDNLPSVITLAFQLNVESARAHYDALSMIQKRYVKNKSKLMSAETIIRALTEERIRKSKEAQTIEDARKAEEARKLKYKNSRPRANVTYRVPLKKKQTTKALKVIGLAGEDKVIKMTSSDRKKAAVWWNEEGSCVIKAGKITGNVTITAVCASGKKVTFQIKVQKKKVKTKKIQIRSRKVYLSAGDKLKLKPERYPITSTEKIRYTSKNKKVVKVTKSGVLKAKKKGSAVIVIKSGKKKLKVKVIVK